MTMTCVKTGRNGLRFQVEFKADDEWITVAFTDSCRELSGVNDARFRVHDTMTDRTFLLGVPNGCQPG